jgi:hypothetical protein
MEPMQTYRGRHLLTGPRAVEAGVSCAEPVGQVVPPDLILVGGPGGRQVVQHRGRVGVGFGVEPGCVAGEETRSESSCASACDDGLGDRGVEVGHTDDRFVARTGQEADAAVGAGSALGGVQSTAGTNAGVPPTARPQERI